MDSSHTQRNSKSSDLPAEAIDQTFMTAFMEDPYFVKEQNLINREKAIVSDGLSRKHETRGVENNPMIQPYQAMFSVHLQNCDIL